jgi:RimJ/RimL family protein N-acetyltransferase
MMANNPAVAQWMPTLPYPYAPEDALAFFHGARQANRNVFVITHDGHLCGVVGLEPNLGYWLGEPFWGLGIGSEAARAMVNHHFTHSRTPLRASYMQGNERSRAVQEKLGFVRTDRSEVTSLLQRKRVTLQHTVLTQADWNAQKAKRDAAQ